MVEQKMSRAPTEEEFQEAERRDTTVAELREQRRQAIEETTQEVLGEETPGEELLEQAGVSGDVERERAQQAQSGIDTQSRKQKQRQRDIIEAGAGRQAAEEIKSFTEKMARQRRQNLIEDRQRNKVSKQVLRELNILGGGSRSKSQVQKALEVRGIESVERPGGQDTFGQKTGTGDVPDTFAAEAYGRAVEKKEEVAEERRELTEIKKDLEQTQQKYKDLLEEGERVEGIEYQEDIILADEGQDVIMGKETSEFIKTDENRFVSPSQLKSRISEIEDVTPKIESEAERLGGVEEEFLKEPQYLKEARLAAEKDIDVSGNILTELGQDITGGVEEIIKPFRETAYKGTGQLGIFEQPAKFSVAAVSGLGNIAKLPGSALTGVGATYEFATKEELAPLLVTGATGLAASQIDYATKNPVKFAGQTAGTALLTYGLAKGASSVAQKFRTTTPTGKPVTTTKQLGPGVARTTSLQQVKTRGILAKLTGDRLGVGTNALRTSSVVKDINIAGLSDDITFGGGAGITTVKTQVGGTTVAQQPFGFTTAVSEFTPRAVTITSGASIPTSVSYSFKPDFTIEQVSRGLTKTKTLTSEDVAQTRTVSKSFARRTTPQQGLTDITRYSIETTSVADKIDLGSLPQGTSTFTGAGRTAVKVGGEVLTDQPYGFTSGSSRVGEGITLKGTQLSKTADIGITSGRNVPLSLTFGTTKPFTAKTTDTGRIEFGTTDTRTITPFRSTPISKGRSIYAAERVFRTGDVGTTIRGQGIQFQGDTSTVLKQPAQVDTSQLFQTDTTTSTATSRPTGGISPTFRTGGQQFGVPGTRLRLPDDQDLEGLTQRSVVTGIDIDRPQTFTTRQEPTSTQRRITIPSTSTTTRQDIGTGISARTRPRVGQGVGTRRGIRTAQTQAQGLASLQLQRQRQRLQVPQATTSVGQGITPLSIQTTSTAGIGGGFQIDSDKKLGALDIELKPQQPPTETTRKPISDWIGATITELTGKGPAITPINVGTGGVTGVRKTLQERTGRAKLDIGLKEKIDIL